MAEAQQGSEAELRLRVAALEAETVRQGEEITRLLKKVRVLEEENDLLALDNEHLREKAKANKGTEEAAATAPSSVEASVAPAAAGLFGSAMARLGTGCGAGGGDGGNKVGIFGLAPDTSYLEEGDGRFPTREALVIEGCSTLNPICCRLFALDSEQQQQLVIAAGGVDKFLTIYTLQKSNTADSFTFTPPVKAAVLNGFPGPLLSLDIAPATVEVVVPAAVATAADGALGTADDAANDVPPRTRRVRPALVTCMDGSHVLVHLDVEDLGESRTAGVVKHAMVGRFSRCGRFLATGGHDKAVRVYDAATGAGGGPGAGGEGRKELKALFFSGNVEALAWVEVDEEGWEDEGDKIKTPYLVIASRGVAHLTYLNAYTWEKRTVSLNQAEWDEHVSFTVLSLAASPCGQYLLAATDKSRLIIYRVGSHLQLHNLYGHRADEYSNPRAVWDGSGKYVYCSSQDGNELVGWSVASERVVAHLKGHTGIVRDVWYEANSGLLLSVGYDKALRVWA